MNCASLETVTFNEGLTEIGGYAFSGCSSLEEVTLPKSLSKLESCVFKNCTSLTDVFIPKSLTTVGSYGAFCGCSSLTDVTFEQGMTAIPDNLFYESGLKQITVPDTVTSIGKYAFYHCESLEAADMSSAPITSIGANAFEKCYILSGVTLPSTLENLGSMAFSRCNALETIEIPASLMSAGGSVYGPFYDAQGLVSVTIEEGADEIAPYLFSRCCALESITVPDGVTKIGDYAFNQCGIKSITLPDSLTTIERDAFYNSGLESITLPDTVTEIGYYSFSKCSSLTYADIGSGVNTLDSDTFRDCSNLETFICTSDDLTFNQYTFYGDSKVTFYGKHSAENYMNSAKNVYNRSYIGTDEHDTMTWSWDGYSAATLTISCEGCDIEDQTLEAVVTSEITTPPTCTEDGVRTYTATATVINGVSYSDQKTEAIPATGHRYGAPEWTWNGYGTAYASFTCVDGDDTQNVNAVITSKITTPATCTTDGVRTYTATVEFEGETYANQKDEVISAPGHDEEIVPGTPATYTSTGLTDGVRCKVCSEWLVEPQVIPKLVSDYVIGDANRDGKLTVRDLTAIQRHISEFNLFDAEQIYLADINMDGVVNIDDATLIQRFLAEYEVPYPIGG